MVAWGNRTLLFVWVLHHDLRLLVPAVHVLLELVQHHVRGSVLVNRTVKDALIDPKHLRSFPLIGTRRTLLSLGSLRSIFSAGTVRLFVDFIHFSRFDFLDILQCSRKY